MHLAEGILPALQALAWFGASAPFVVHSARKLQRDRTRRPLVGVATALTFAVTLFPIPVPGLGATSHMCATPFLALLLGPSVMALPVTLSLLVQAVLFAHGGLSTLGANVFTLGVAGPWVAWALARGFRRLGLGAPLAVGLACALGAVAVYGLDAVMLGLALRGAQPFGHWVKVALLGFAPVQTPLLVLEGVLSALLLVALARRREELVPAWLRPGPSAALPALLGLALLAQPQTGPALPPAGTAQPQAASAPLAGLDETVIEQSARNAGRRPRPLVDLTEGEGGLALFMAGGLVAGFILGRHWERWTLQARKSTDGH
jgi:cobalt/nickel transport system permease protein